MAANVFGTVVYRGIAVDKRLRTTQKHIYAVGDCNGGVQFTHAASEQAITAVLGALFNLPKKFSAEAMPWATFTTPEIAHFGPVKSDLHPESFRALRIDFKDIDKAVTEHESGFIEVLTTLEGKITGATVLGTGAAEILGQIKLLHDFNIPLQDVAGVVQAYPTYSLGLKQLGANAIYER
ncbi:MAG TPA: FAD-dependent oxidoreductase [Candidatus Paceibacterota bacterium]|nr:FAD-dependent oxidoreductase [Candidatus Paceibacterota bacterium]